MTNRFIKKRLEIIQENILLSCQKSGRKSDEIKIIAVTKGINVDFMQEALTCGLNRFGENRVQEAEQKRIYFQEKPIEWHFIGQLQRNKIPKVVEYFQYIHSLDQVNQLQALEKRLKLQKKDPFPVFIQINLTGKETQAGLEKQNVIPFLESMQFYSRIRVKGLMTIGPQGNPDEIRRVFRELHQLKEKIEDKNYSWVSPRLDLSMGMSDDYPIAVEEGATYLRLGRCLFGERSY
ncbi:MAG: YggS family pyridoxal phosphate-dependent enzyme [Candidatus Atribacteria bacterium]|nr:YggS family pyridoxal phosphate-dependent enzyme [Candidatus Atribacteria bacterium]